MQCEWFKTDDVAALMGRCTIGLAAGFAEVAPAVRSCHLTARLKSGWSVAAGCRRSLEDDESDPGWAQAVGKFNAFTRDRLRADARERLVARVSKLESERARRGLLALT